MPDRTASLAAARGDIACDLLLKGGRVVNVYSGEIETADVAVHDGWIVGVGQGGTGYDAKQTIDVAGRFVAPGLIDAHVHIESSLCVAAQFAAAVLPRGVTTVVTDPHEIANVLGVAGVRFMADSRRGVPLRIEIMAPSCVPATHLATAGAKLSADDLGMLLADGTVLGLAEVMDFPGVVGGRLVDKITRFIGRPVDGHCPGLTGKPLNAYIAAGIHSDHESVTIEEAKLKLARGLTLFIREATNARNLDALLPLVTPGNCRRICFCTDDRQPADLLTTGGIDDMVRRAIAFGVDPVDAFRMATLNPAEYFGLTDRGAIAPGKSADLFVFDDLKSPRAGLVFAKGEPVHGYEPGDTTAPPGVRDCCKVDVAGVDFRVPANGTNLRVIGVRPNQLVTDSLVLPAMILNGYAVADPSRDLLKMAVIERHGSGVNVGLGFVAGLGLNRGAIAGTVAHDHHNLVVIGVDDDSMRSAANAAAAGGGGLAVCDGSAVIARLPLPVAGLMSDRPIGEVRDRYESLLNGARSLGSSLHDPFMAMSFLALEVIPSLKLTDQGLVDVDRFERVGLWVVESA